MSGVTDRLWEDEKDPSTPSGRSIGENGVNIVYGHDDIFVDSRSVREPRIVLVNWSEDTQPSLTAAEARELSAALLHMAHMIETEPA